MEIPSEILTIAEKLSDSGYKAYLVGGCVRDLLLNKKPKDWDIATDAVPEDILRMFPNSIYENSFGTVAVKTNSSDEVLKIVEVTTFRLEGRYSDKRHPDEIKFAKSIEEDLARRDFTVNALAVRIKSGQSRNGIIPIRDYPCLRRQAGLEKCLVDPYKGRKDLESKVIRAVGDPTERFNEDALRLMRAVRFACELNFSIEENTEMSIKDNAGLLVCIARERVRDEFARILLSERAMFGVQLLEDFGLMRFIMPELEKGINCGQNKHHIYNVWEHSLRSLDYATKQNYSLEIRLAALLHDLGKPDTKRGEGPDSTFYGHEIVGAEMAQRVLGKLKFPKEIVEKVTHLVRYHLFYYNVGDVTEAGVRRFLRRVGPEYVDDLIKVREADRIGSGVPKAVPYKLRHLLFMIDKVKKDPISPKMLKINGDVLISKLGLEPGPIIGAILDILLDDVLEDPAKNKEEILLKRAEDLSSMSYQDLFVLRQKAKSAKEEFEAGIEKEMKKKHWVK